MDIAGGTVRGECQALVFLLGEGRFGIDILQIQEIRGSDRPTAIPSAPEYFKGVTNLRGQFVPVIDLRVRFGIAVPKDAPEGVTIILRRREDRVGVVVDAVSEVMSMAPEDVKPPPSSEFAPSADYLRGLVSHGDETVVLLDIERLLASTQENIGEIMSRVQESSLGIAA